MDTATGPAQPLVQVHMPERAPVLMATSRRKPGPKPGQNPKDGPTMEPDHNKHKLGHGLAHDLTQMRAKVSRDLYRVRDKMLMRMEYMLDNNPSSITFANLSIAYGIFTDKQLLMETGPVSTTNNTVIINGLSRNEALTFLRGDTGPNGFLVPKPMESIEASACVDMSQPVQNTPVLVDNAQPVQR